MPLAPTPLSARNQLIFRAHRQQCEEAKRCAEYKGQSLQTFLHSAMMKTIAETRAEMEKKNSGEEPFTLRKGRRQKAAPLSMRERLAARRARSDELEATDIDPPPPTAATPAPSIVIHNGTPNNGTTDPVPLLAKWVAAGESYQRRERLKIAGTQLAAFTDDEKQQAEWVERLADEISKIDRRKAAL